MGGSEFKLSSRIAIGLFLVLSIGILAGCNLAGEGRHRPSASDSPVHVQGGSMTLECKNTWKPAGPVYTCDATDTSIVIFEDKNAGGLSKSLKVDGPWIIYSYGKGSQGKPDKTRGVKLCTSQDSSSGVCDIDAGTHRGQFVALSTFGAGSLALSGNDYVFSCEGASCDMNASYLSANGNMYSCKRSKGCHIGIGPKPK